jgi:phosphatidate phosphatase APP1
LQKLLTGLADSILQAFTQLLKYFSKHNLAAIPYILMDHGGQEDDRREYPRG